MAEVVDLTAINSDDEQQPAAPTIDLTKDSDDDEQPPVKRARREAEARDGLVKIVAWNASGILPKTGKNRDKLARLVQRLGRRRDRGCTVKRGEEAAAARCCPVRCYITRPGNDAPGAQGRRRPFTLPRRFSRRTTDTVTAWDRGA